VRRLSEKQLRYLALNARASHAKALGGESLPPPTVSEMTFLVRNRISGGLGTILVRFLPLHEVLREFVQRLRSGTNSNRGYGNV
jgi:hypothetical protein